MKISQEQVSEKWQLISEAAASRSEKVFSVVENDSERERERLKTGDSMVGEHSATSPDGGLQPHQRVYI